MNRETPEALERDAIARFADFMGRVVPDALSTSVALFAVLFIAALALGNSLATTMDAYYQGLWMLLPFTMQVTLILVLSGVLAATPLFKAIVAALSEIPSSKTQVVAFSILLTCFMAYFYWGLSIALGPLVAIHFCRQAERKGIQVDFPFLLAAMGAAGSVWQFGFSASAPLLMATEGHFLQKEIGVMSLRSTIGSPAAILHTLIFIVALIIVARILLPKSAQPLSAFPDAEKLADVSHLPEDASLIERSEAGHLHFSERVERSRWVFVIPILALVGWLYLHFIVKDKSLDLNALNTILLALCFLLHGTVERFSRALREATLSCWAVIVLYHLYAGIAGLIQYTTVGERFAELFAAISTRYTFPFLTALSGTIVAIFVPSSGGQWTIQGFITCEAARTVGVSPQRGLLAMSVGDQMGNLISPFWPVVAAGIARVEFRKFFGYGLVFAALWFVIGVLAFTFLPC